MGEMMDTSFLIKLSSRLSGLLWLSLPRISAQMCAIRLCGICIRHAGHMAELRNMHSITSKLDSTDLLPLCCRASPSRYVPPVHMANFPMAVTKVFINFKNSQVSFMANLKKNMAE